MDGPAENHNACPGFRNVPFRHANHEFPVTIKAVVFDAYGTLYDIQSVAAVTRRSRARWMNSGCSLTIAFKHSPICPNWWRGIHKKTGRQFRVSPELPAR
jgi:hypothetical protein